MPTKPLAYFITFSSYGTHLHGNKNESIDRNHNQYGTDRIPSQPHLERYESESLKNSPVAFSQNHRQIILESIMRVCGYYNWHLFAVHVRTNHVHAIVSADTPPEKILHGFKANATRHLRQSHPVFADLKIWTRHGSTKYLWDRKALVAAMSYVIHEQGGLMECWFDKNIVG